jgi:predicted amidohydrolase
MSKILAACAQIECRPGDVAANLEMHLDAIVKARREGVELLAFPELSLTDYLSKPDIHVLSRTVDGAEVRAIAAAAGDMTVSFGFIERDSEGRVYNSQALVSDGHLKHTHRKLNLPTYGKLLEGHYYSAGATLALAPILNARKVATLICADSWNPALTWLAALQQPDLLIQPIASARGAVDGDFDNPMGWEINLRHTAMTYGLPVMMVNHCGRRSDLDFWGGSRILDPYGHELARAGETPDLILAELDFARAESARRNLPTIRDATPAFIAEELRRIMRRC